MKTFKKMLLILVAILIISSIGGYFYFDQKFTPPENYLQVAYYSDNIPIEWVSTNSNSHAALLLPVNLKGIDKLFYMQLDFGSPTTIFYKAPLESIREKFPMQISFPKKTNGIPLALKLQNMQVSSNSFKVIDYGVKVDFENKENKNIIGTLGTDLLEKRIVTLDFKNDLCSFSERVLAEGFSDFEFKKRRILLPATIGNENLKFMYDSGTSGYELIVSKEDWKKFRSGEGKEKTDKGNSWGNTLKIVSAPANQKIQFVDTTLSLSEVTYIEGTSKIQHALMALSGMQGMIGNRLFLNHKIILDCKNEKFKVE
ncbi:hypothetical protein GCM10027429_13180 [Marivirga atlantica]|uniref:Aspartyl protease n=1 Tax=Marivirga atlantica TaxID=1548457 RepID=A0A937DJ77_9BACT|nr:hypothetical protein [Marivirga atlantica]MBL0764931.1 hypothetical protein [Marivirga atlantica]